MTTYYVDNASSAASDKNAGTSADAPLADLAGAANLKLKAGDTVALMAGTTYTGSKAQGGLLNLSASGTASAPITVTSYGTGAAPVIDNTSSSQSADGIDLDGSYETVSGLAFTGAGNAAVQTGANSSHDTITNNTMTGTGFGVYAYGTDQTVSHNTISSLHMVNDTPTSVNNNDDYGAVGVVVNGNGDKVASNRIIDAKASSYDYGVDGGAVETWGDVTGLSVHDNYAQGDAGFFEGGGGNVSNATFSNNVSVDDGDFLVLHNGGGDFAGNYSNIDVSHNTVVESGKEAYQNSTVAPDAALSSGALKFDDNVVASGDGQSVFGQGGAEHSGNLFSLTGGTALGTTAGSGDSLGTATFANAASGDYVASGTTAGATLTMAETGAGTSSAATSPTNPPSGGSSTGGTTGSTGTGGTGTTTGTGASTTGSTGSHAGHEGHHHASSGGSTLVTAGGGTSGTSGGSSNSDPTTGSTSTGVGTSTGTSGPTSPWGGHHSGVSGSSGVFHYSDAPSASLLADSAIAAGSPTSDPYATTSGSTTAAAANAFHQAYALLGDVDRASIGSALNASPQVDPTATTLTIDGNTRHGTGSAMSSTSHHAWLAA